MPMDLAQHGIMKLLSGLPVVGHHFKAKLDKQLLVQLEMIEARFSNASTRFSTQLHDLYDCLKHLEGPFELEPRHFHTFELVSHTKTSNDAVRLLERLKVGAFVPNEDYFKSGGIGRKEKFLDWFSNEGSYNEFVSGMLWLLHVYCTNVSRVPSEDGDPFVVPAPCNEMTETFIGSKWFKLLILDLIQSLTVVYTQRTGG